MSVASVVLNIVTIVIVFVALFYHGEKLELPTRKASDSATDVLEANRTDPLVVGRAYFDESKVGNIGKFTAYDPVPETHWMYGYEITNT
jgi:hypothetical protein